MSKLAKKLSKRIVAIALSVAMIMPNMAVYANEVEVTETQEGVIVEPEELEAEEPLLIEEETESEEDGEENVAEVLYIEDEAASDSLAGEEVTYSLEGDTVASAVFRSKSSAFSEYNGFTIEGFGTACATDGHGAKSAQTDATITLTLSGNASDTVDIEVLLCAYGTKTAATMTATVKDSSGNTSEPTVVKEIVGEDENSSNLESYPAPKYTILGVAGNSEVKLTFHESGTYVHSIKAVKRNSGVTYYTIDVESGENGTASASPVYAAAGETITLTAKPDNEYELDDWTVESPTTNVPVITKDSSDNNKATFTMPADNVKIKASFTEVLGAVYNINVLDGYHGTAALKSGQGTGIEKDTEITLANVVEATPEDGYTFESWYVTQTIGSTTTDITVSEGKFTMPACDVYVIPIFSGDAKDGYTYNFRNQTGTDRTKNSQLADFGIISFDGFADNDNSHGFYTNKADATMKLNLSDKATVTVETCVYNSVSTGMTATIGDTVYTPTVKNTTEANNGQSGKEYTVKVNQAGELVLTFENSNNYVHNIKVDYDKTEDNPPSDAPRTEWDFTDTTDTTLPAVTYQSSATKEGEYAGLLIDATEGKFDRNTSNKYAQVNAGTKIKVPVTGVETNEGVKVYVQWYKNATTVDYTVAGKDMTCTVGHVYSEAIECKGTDGYVEIVAKTDDYIEKIKIEPIKDSDEDEDDDYDPSSYDPKIDIWDIGLDTFDTDKYNNRLTKDILSAMTFGNNAYESLDAEGILTFHTYQSGKERLYHKDGVNAPYTHKGSLTNGLTGADLETYAGYLYINSAGSNYWFEIEAEAGDIVTVYASYNTNPAQYSFFKKESDTITKVGDYDTINVPADAQKATVAASKTIATPLKFYAPETGIYAFCTSNETAEKLVVARVTREHNKRIAVSGTVTSPAGVSASDLTLQFTCKETGAVKKVKIDEDGTYSVNLYERYSYDIIVLPTNYIISKGSELEINRFDDNATLEKTHDITVAAVDLYTLSGSINGLDNDALAAVEISFVKPNDKLYQPEVTLDRANKTYTAELEKGVTYTIKTEGINDYELDETVTGNDETVGPLTAAGTRDIIYKKKPVYEVKLTLTEDGEDISSELKAAGAEVTFTNLGLREGCEDDEGYSYTFDIDDTIELRDGVYKVEVTNSGAYVQNLTPNVVIDGEKADGYTKEITFNSNITEWDFSSSDWTSMTESKPAGYKGLVFNEVKNECAKDKPHAVLLNTATETSTIKIPIDTAKDWNVAVTYYYSANAKFENEAKASIYFETTVNNPDTTAIYEYKAGSNLVNDGYVTITALTGGYGTNEEDSVSTYIKKIKLTHVVDYKATVTVGASGCDYQTINEALDEIRAMDRNDNGTTKPVTISIQPGNYEEMLVIDMDNVKLVNASSAPSTALKNKGVDIDDNAVRITSYYGHGYSYYSMGSDYKWDADILEYNKANGYASVQNPGSGTSTYWNATVVISGSNVSAEGIIFENSFNQYVSAKAAADTIVAQAGQAKEGSTARASMSVGDTTVQDKSYVERAAALAITNNCSQIYFENCKFIGRQDTLYGGTPTTAAFYKCQIYGGTDYIFGGMTAVFAKCELVFNTSDDNNDVGYITASQTSAGQHGYLMYNAHVTSTTPGEDTASTYTSKPGYFGRPWSANTGEALFYMTEVDEVASYWQGNPSGLKDELKGTSLIAGEAWGDGLSGKSALSQEYGTYEMSGVDNTSDRADWATVLSPDDAKVKAQVSYFLGTWNPFEGKDMEIKVVAPVYATPAAGIVEEGTEVTLDVLIPEDAAIYYTTDETEPTESEENLYTSGAKITINENTVIKAIAKKEGYLDERPVAEFEYTVGTVPIPTEQVEMPAADPVDGSTVAIGDTITLSSATSGAVIYYTADGTSPSDTNGILYVNGIAVEQSIINESDNTVIINAIAVKEGMNDSDVVTFRYTYDPNKKAQVAKPYAEPAQGPVAKGTVVKLKTATADAKIYYTKGTDKDTLQNPDANSELYTDSGITITEDTVIKAIAVKDDMDDSEVVTFTYTISNGTIIGTGKGLEIILAKKDYTYTGSAIIPEYAVTYDGKPLIPSIDYTVKFSNNTKVAEGKASITVTGKGNLSGKTVETFNIKQKSLAYGDKDGAGEVAGDKLVVVEDAKATPILSYNGVKLGTKDFEFSNSSDKSKKWALTDDGTTVTVKAKDGGSFTGSRDLEVVVISKEAQKNAKLVVTLDSTANKNLTYTGGKIEPKFTVTNKGNKELKSGTDYIVSYPSDMVSAGKKKFTVIGISADCIGTVTKTYTVKPAAKEESKVKVSLGDKEVSVDNTKLAYVSTGVTFAQDELVVAYDGTPLTQGVDYKITYSANKKVGTAKYTITGLGNYKGVKKTGQFTIEAAAMSEENVTVIVPDKAFANSKVYKSTPYVIEKASNTLLKTSNYKLTYWNDAAATQPISKSEAASTVYVKIEGKGGYDSTTSIIKPYGVKEVNSGAQDLSTAKITFYDSAGATKASSKFGYTGENVRPYSMKITFKDKSDIVVVLDENDPGFDAAKYNKFKVEFVNDVNKGKASVIVTSNDDNSYIGGKTATFSITARSLNGFTWGDALASSVLELFK